jgi:hypothetical protein
MPITPGARLGSYEVLTPIGAFRPLMANWIKI